MRRIFIVNRHAGRSATKKNLARLGSLLGCDPSRAERTSRADWVLADSRDAATRATREALSEGFEQIVAVGGDGTVNAVANGFFQDGRPIRKDACLVVANTGTGSDYFRGLVADSSATHWSDLIERHTVRAVDVGHLHFADPTQESRYFVNMASVGLVADVVSRKNSAARWLPRKLRYIGPTLGALWSAKSHAMRIEADGLSEQVNALAVTISKGAFAGGGMRFGGRATLFDGHFDVSIILTMSRGELLAKVPKLYSGTMKDDRKVMTFRTTRLSISSEQPVAIEFDGELHGSTDVEVSIVPKSLAVCFPEVAQ